jgi:hypothetical protein
MTRQLRLVEPSSITLNMEEDLRCALNLARALRFMGSGMPRDQAEPVVEMADIMIDRLKATTERWRKLHEVLVQQLKPSA